MSLLNIALQNCTLERDAMSDRMENRMKNVNNMNHLRNVASRDDGLKEAFQQSEKSSLALDLNK